MRPRDRRPSTPFLNRRDQRRMLLLTGALVAVLVSMKLAADPARWDWVAGPVPGDGEPTLEDVDFTVALADDGPPPGAFRSVPDPAAGSTDGAGGDDAADGDLATLHPRLTAAFEDDRLKLSRAERDAVDLIFARLADADAAALDAAAEPVSFPVLMTEPGHHRGRLVRITGTMLGLWPAVGGERDGRPARWEAWVIPPEAGNNPVRVLALSADDLPRGRDLNPGVPVRFAGYFLKRQGYANSVGDLHVAPLLVAARLEPVPVAAVPAPPAGLVWGLLGAVLAAFAGASVLVWRWKRGDAAFEDRTLRRVTDASRSAPVAPAAEGAEPDEFLRSLGAADADRPVR